MLNSNLLNAVLLWWWAAPAWVATQDNFIFNWYSLNDWTTKRVTNSNHDDLWTIDFKTFNAPRVDWWWVLGRYYRKKVIRLDIALTSTTEDWLNTLIDSFKENTRETEWYLEITINSEIRRVKASITSLKFNRKYYNISFVQNVQMTFTTMEPHFYAKTEESISFLNISADLTEEIVSNWSIETEPRIYIIFGATVTALSSVAVNIWDNTITIAETINANDVIIIDWENKTVTINSLAVDYTWTFPILDVWWNTTIFTFSWWATFTCDITAIYKKKYL